MTDSGGPSNYELNRGLGRTNPFAAVRGDEMAMRTFVEIL